jgi:hypothetical protein
MRFSLVVTTLLAGLSVSALAQQSNEFRVKSSAPKERNAAPLPVGKTNGAGTASESNAKNLQALEHQTAKTAGATPRSTVRKNPSALKPIQNEPNPPINFSTSGTKSAKTGGQGFKQERVREKHTQE